MKKVFVFILAAGMLFSLFSFFAHAEETTFTLKIVHTNDIHARVSDNEKSGIIGLSRVKSVKDAFIGGADLALTLDSGDLFHGQPIATLEKGMSIAELVSAVGYDAITAGNHDWNYGKNALKTLSSQSGAVMLTGNVEKADGTKFFDREYLIKTVEKDGQTLKVGLFGVIDPQLTILTSPENVAGLVFEDQVTYANRAAAELRAQGCQVVIALTHAYDPVGTAKKVDGVDLWLAGHEHVIINEEVTTDSGEKSYVIEGGYYLYNMSTVGMSVTLGSGGAVNVTIDATVCDYGLLSEYAQDQDVLSLLSSISARQENVLKEKVGSSPVDLTGMWENLRMGQRSIGRAICEAYLKETGADVAFENAGGIRASISAGDVTYGDILGVSPYGNIVVTKKITGAQLKEILETVLQIEKECIAADESGEYTAWPQNSGNYLQGAGFELVYNPELPQGKRIISLYVGGEECEDDRLYTVASNNYVMVNGEYQPFVTAEEAGEFRACEEVLADYFAQGADAVGATLTGETFTVSTQVPAGETPTVLWFFLSLGALAVAVAIAARKKEKS